MLRFNNFNEDTFENVADVSGVELLLLLLLQQQLLLLLFPPLLLAGGTGWQNV